MALPAPRQPWAGRGFSAGLSQHPVSCFGGESTCNCHETLTLRGWQGQDNFASAPFIHIFCLTHAKEGSSPWGSRAPAFPSGCLSSEPGPCCIPTAGLCLQPPSALAGFTAPILGALKRGLWVVLGERWCEEAPKWCCRDRVIAGPGKAGRRLTQGLPDPCLLPG